jgi:predicted DNA-binding protein
MTEQARKTEQVRVSTTHYEKLQMLSDLTGHSVRWMLDRAVELFLAQEAPVYEAAFKEARKKLSRGERQPVRLKGLAR